MNNIISYLVFISCYIFKFRYLTNIKKLADIDTYKFINEKNNIQQYTHIHDYNIERTK